MLTRPFVQFFTKNLFFFFNTAMKAIPSRAFVQALRAGWMSKTDASRQVTRRFHCMAVFRKIENNVQRRLAQTGVEPQY